MYVKRTIFQGKDPFTGILHSKSHSNEQIFGDVYAKHSTMAVTQTQGTTAMWLITPDNNNNINE